MYWYPPWSIIRKLLLQITSFQEQLGQFQPNLVGSIHLWKRVQICERKKPSGWPLFGPHKEHPLDKKIQICKNKVPGANFYILSWYRKKLRASLGQRDLSFFKWSPMGHKWKGPKGGNLGKSLKNLLLNQ